MASNDIISIVAPIIPNPVDLTNPNWIVQIEIIGDNVGISKIKPENIFSTKLAFDTKDEQQENWFLE